MRPPSKPQTTNFSYVGLGYYSLTWRCYARQPHFLQGDRVELVRAQFLRASTETNVVAVAHCYMPDHVHQLVRGESADADAKQYIARGKQYSGYYFKKAFGVKLWERDGFHRVLLADEQPVIVARYIMANPVRAGLVAQAQNYPHTGSEVYSFEQLVEWAYGPDVHLHI
jgi:putative transposase